jgi:hypothetical protein
METIAKAYLLLHMMSDPSGQAATLVSDQEPEVAQHRLVVSKQNGDVISIGHATTLSDCQDQANKAWGSSKTPAHALISCPEVGHVK